MITSGQLLYYENDTKQNQNNMACILLKKQPFYVHKKLSKIPTSSMRELKIGILFSWTKGKKSEKLFGILILVVIAQSIWQCKKLIEMQLSLRLCLSLKDYIIIENILKSLTSMYSYTYNVYNNIMPATTPKCNINITI